MTKTYQVFTSLDAALLYLEQEVAESPGEWSRGVYEGADVFDLIILKPELHYSPVEAFENGEELEDEEFKALAPTKDGSPQKERFRVRLRKLESVLDGSWIVRAIIEQQF